MGVGMYGFTEHSILGPMNKREKEEGLRKELSTTANTTAK